LLPKTMIRSISLALESYGRAWPILWQPALRPYRWLPLLLQIVLFAGAMSLLFQYSRPLSDTILSLWPWPVSSSWQWVESLLLWLLRLILLLVYFSVLKYLTLIVMTPFLTLLSEKTEQIQTGRSYPFSLGQVLRDLLRAVQINGFNLLAELLITGGLLLFTWLPVVGWLSPFLILAVQSYFFGFSLLDFNTERWRYSFRATRRWMWRHKWYVTTQGLVFHFLFLIPVLGWIWGPLWSTIAGTLGFLRWQEQEQSPIAEFQK